MSLDIKQNYFEATQDVRHKFWFSFFDNKTYFHNAWYYFYMTKVCHIFKQLDLHSDRRNIMESLWHND